MKNLKRTLITVVAMILVCVISVAATLAYLYDASEKVVNTFSVGNVEITLDEAAVNKYGELLDKDGNVWVTGKTLADRVTANEYKLISGATYVKDPTVHVSATSEESYIFIKVDVGDAVADVLVDKSDKDNGEKSIAAQLSNNGWTLVTGTTNCYQYSTTINGIEDGAQDLVVFEEIMVKTGASGADLVEAGFVAGGRGKNPGTGRDVREVRYRLKDNYTRFYLKYVLPRYDAIKEGLFRYVSIDRLPNWDSIMGLQFENLVLNNFQSLSRRIGLIGKCVESVAPYFRRGRTSGDGVQIDMLVQLPRSVYLIEVKRMNRIPVSVEDEVQRKIDRLPLKKGVSVKTVLVYDGNLAPELEEDGFFDYLVDMDQLMRGRSC